MVELHRGVYLAGTVRPRYADEMAALLAFRLSATISHRSALEIWELPPSPAPREVWVTVPPGVQTERNRITTYRAALSPRDIRMRHGMQVTSPPRTILDMAAFITDPYDLERLVAEAHFRRLAREPELRDQLERNPRKRGAAGLRAVLDLPGGPRRTRSGGERALLRLLRSRGIDGYEVNARVAGFEVDFLFRPARDRTRRLGRPLLPPGVRTRPFEVGEAQGRGFGVMPITGRRVRDDPDGVIERLSAARRD
jgi:hypothetical protein